MIVDRDKLANADISIHTTWNKAFENTPVQYPLVAQEVPSTGRVEEYEWLGASPDMKELLGEAQFEQLRGYKYTLTNKEFQTGLEVKRADIEDDRLGLIRPTIAEMASRAKRHPDKLILGDLLPAGFAGTMGLAYDGQYFFDTDHKDGDGPTQSNKITDALDEEGVEKALKLMRSLKDERGESLELVPTDIFVPPALEFTAVKLLENARKANGEDNHLTGRLKVNVVNRWAGVHDTKWYVMALGHALKPFVYQVREAVKFASLEDWNSELVMRKLKYLYSVYGRYNAGFGLWQYAIGSDGTT